MRTQLSRTTAVLAMLALAAPCACSSDLVSDGPVDLSVQQDLRFGLDGPPPDLAAPDLLEPADLTEVVDLADPGVGRVCGGRGGKPCAAALFCEIPVDCGRADENGTCQVRPAVCGKNLEPECGCDGVAYDNDCLRQKAGVSLLNHGICGCSQQCGAGNYCANCFGTPQCIPVGAVC